MKKIYTLIQEGMNGTVTMWTHTDSFSTRELAELSKEAVEKANKANLFAPPIWCTIQESTVFENKEEVPILNND